MKIAFSKIIFVSALMCSVVICAPQTEAQQTAATPAKPHSPGPFGATTAYSPDGLRTAYWGEEYPAVLYIKTKSTNEATVVLRSARLHKDWMVVDGLAFSPDGDRLIFEAGPPRQFVGDIYITSLDGQDVKVLASDRQELPDSTGKTVLDVGISKPLFSPDGKQVLVELTETDGKRDDQGRIDHEQDKTFVALISSSGEEQTPEILVEGRPLFWSNDGTAIYYLGDTLNRFDIRTRKSTPVAWWNQRYWIIAKAPEAHDAVFAFDSPSGYGNRCPHEGCTLRILNLDGSAVDPQLVAFVNSIPVKDSQGRILGPIRNESQGRLLLSYSANVPGVLNSTQKHDELVQFPQR